ncbi:unnamed protein product [Schistosoma mattheei]|uniref:Eukaryotic translation initiation factor 4E-binding protein 1 n=1 Tax=Schistosoma mattheei TaxID=31246 RepID=A0A183NVZ0_9TREM|nr:unnamed protein product [Schistosoma mattheei]VDP33050.1 unnamed protein product [Schistosoma mattheei]
MERQQTEPIPVKKVTVKDLSQIPSNHGTTPGGTLFSTTPGGTRIIYERDFILNCRNSPLARTPPSDMIFLPEITPSSLNDDKTVHPCNGHKVKDSLNVPESTSNDHSRLSKGEEAPFEMDI